MSHLTPALMTICKERDIGTERASRVFGFEVARWDNSDVERVLLQIEPLIPKAGSSDPYGPAFNQTEPLTLQLRALSFGVRSLGILLLFPFQVVSAAYVGIWRWKWQAVIYEIPKPTMTIARLYSSLVTFIKPPRSLVEESIALKSALCVNRRGQFKLISPQCETKYACLSYVWGYIMAWQKPQHWGAVELSIRRQGLPLQHLERLFDVCCENILRSDVKKKEDDFIRRVYDYEWMFLDVIAMPEILENMDDTQQQETELLRVGVINNLASIYKHADRVTVADGVLLRLSSGSMIDCAVTLCCGRWITRLWTLVESFLARKVLIRTADYAFDLDEMITFITKNVPNDEGRYWNILQSLCCLRPTPKDSQRLLFDTPDDQQIVREGGKIHILKDIRWATRNRYTNVRVDHVRILFPLLGVQWKAGWSVEDGFGYLYELYPAYRKFLAAYYQYREDHINKQGCVRGKIWENGVVEAGLAEGY